MSSKITALKDAVRNIPDFPKPGIQFKDITPILGQAHLFQEAVEQLTFPYQPGDIDVVVGIDARGFIFAAAAALHLKTGFVPIRKKGKLPYQTHEEQYDLEYGSNEMAIHTDAIPKGSRTLLMDDLLATGGTAGAAVRLLNKLEVNLLEAVFLVELDALRGRDLLPEIPVRSIISF
ncbi:adenine phosphoribosyltransferase [Verrucomicrobia bacterium]|jgi:adenine phosphoribosyltransferase|nr:adenine phosphoribosyltransferase [Verrucomicrobiota bacterium]